MPEQSKLLIFSSDAEMLMALVAALEDKYSLVDLEAQSEVVEQVEGECPDLVIVDDMLLEPNCYEICKALEADAATRQIPVVLLTELPPAEAEPELSLMGADDFVCKPIDKSQLLEKVGTLLMVSQMR